MALCPRTLVSDYMCWHFTGGKAFAFMMWKRKDMWTHGMNMTSFGYIPVCWSEANNQEVPLAFAICLSKHREFRFSWSYISFSDARWVEREGEENTRKRSLIEPRKVGKFALILMGSTQEGPESELGGSCKTALDFSKVIYIWLLITTPQKVTSNNIYCKSEVRRSLGSCDQS